MNTFDQDYKKILNEILENAEYFSTRGHKTLYLFGKELRIDMREGFPITTLRKIGFKSTISEILWDVSGSSRISDLNNRTFEKVWSEYDNGEGYVNHTYARFWRSFPGTRPQDNNINKVPNEDFRISSVDQLNRAQQLLKENPTSRQNVVLAMSPTELKTKGDLGYNCHTMFTLNSNGTYCDMHVFGRSWDAVVGLPGDCIRYGALLHCLATYANLIPRFLQFSTTNLHIYNQHIKIADQLSKAPYWDLPSLQVKDANYKKMWYLQVDNFALINYNSNKAINVEFVK